MEETSGDKINQALSDYARGFEEYKWTCQKATNILDRFALSHPEIVYSVKSRIKTAKSLINKLRKGRQAADIVGLRILYYFREDLRKIDEYVIENFECEEITVYVFKDDEDILKGMFPEDVYEQEEIRLKIDTDKPSKTGYTGIHYKAYLRDRDRQNHSRIAMEIQLKNLFEEAWGELEHDIGYKYPPINIKRFFLQISKRLSIERETMSELRKYIEKQTKELYKAVDDYYHSNLLEQNTRHSAILQLLIDLDVEVEKAVGEVRNLDKLSEPYRNILPIDDRFKTLRTVLDPDETSVNRKLTGIKSKLIQMLFENLLRGQPISEDNGALLKSFSLHDEEFARCLRGLGSVLKGIKIRGGKGIDTVSEFLREVRQEDERKLPVIEMVLKIWDRIKLEDLVEWESFIRETFKSAKDDRVKAKLIQIIERSPTPSDIPRKQRLVDLLDELKKCFCQAKRGPLDSRKGDHFGHLA